MNAPAPRLTPAQRTLLSKLCKGEFTRSAVGRDVHRTGAIGSAMNALVRKGLVDVNDQPTPAGRAMFAPLPNSAQSQAGRIRARALNLLAVLAAAFALGASHLLDGAGPDEPATAQAMADDQAEAIAQLQAQVRAESHAPH